MRKVRVLPALLSLIALLWPLAASAQTSGSVKGTAVILQRVTLPSNAVVTFQLVDASLAGATTVLATQSFTTNGLQAPFQFELRYDPTKIQQNGVYVVQGNVSVDGRQRYATTQQYRVIAGGNPTNITITLDSVSPLPTTSGNSSLLGAALALLALALCIRLLRPGLLASPQA